MSDTEQRWTPHPFFGPEYEIGWLSGVCSAEREITIVRNGVETTHHLKRKELSGKHAQYRQYKLCKGGKIYSRREHVLVAETYHGPRPPGKEACHTDGNRQNNTAQNVRWDTRQNNISDKALHGTQTSGEDHPVTKYTEDLVAYIRDDLLTKNQVTVANEWQLPYATIGTIKQMRVWRDVEPRPLEPFTQTYVIDPEDADPE